MSDQKLKPCPCCGSIDDVEERPYLCPVDDWGRRQETGFVKCRKCGLRMEAGSGQKYAIERWNRRKPVDALLDALLDAEEALIGHEMNYEETCGRNRSYDHMEEQEAWSETIYKIREAIKLAGGEK